MATLSVRLAAGEPRRRFGNHGAWRAVVSAPAMVGSLLLLLVMLSWMGQFEGVALLCWIASGAALFSRHGERLAVRFGAGFRRPTRHQCALLAPAWSAALSRCGLATDEVDLYVQRSSTPNAFAAGGRSVAVTSGVLAKFQARRLGDEHLEAILIHELGHHATKATRLGLVTLWLGAPWHIACRVVIGTGMAVIGRRQPLRLLAVVVVTGFVVAVVQAVEQRRWTAALGLGALAVCTVVCPLADAAVCRFSEYAADRYVAAVGLGPELARALTLLTTSRRSEPGLAARLLSHHPDVDHRVDVLTGTAASLAAARSRREPGLVARARVMFGQRTRPTTRGLGGSSCFSDWTRGPSC